MLLALPKAGGGEGVIESVMGFLVWESVESRERGEVDILEIAELVFLVSRLLHDPALQASGADHRIVEVIAECGEFLAQDVAIDLRKVAHQHRVTDELTQFAQNALGRFGVGDVLGAELVDDYSCGGHGHSGIDETIELLAEMDPGSSDSDSADGKQAIGAAIQRSEFGVENDEAYPIDRRFFCKFRRFALAEFEDAGQCQRPSCAQTAVRNR